MNHKATRRSFLRVAGIGMAACVTIPASAASEAEQPNMIVISLDDSGFADFTPFGNTSYPTPNIQKLAFRGCRFANFRIPQALHSTSCDMGSKWSELAQIFKQRGYTHKVLSKGCTEHAVDFIKRHKRAPFFLHLSHKMRHPQLSVSEKFENRSGEGLYADLMMEIDWSVGEITNALADAGIDKTTLIVFSSGNGPWGNCSGNADTSPQ